MGDVGGAAASMRRQAPWPQELGLRRHGTTDQDVSSSPPHHRTILQTEIHGPQTQIQRQPQ